jgi:uncharacterized membrane protein YidH (DUF202 family)
MDYLTLIFVIVGILNLIFGIVLLSIYAHKYTVDKTDLAAVIIGSLMLILGVGMSGYGGLRFLKQMRGKNNQIANLPEQKNEPNPITAGMVGQAY